MGWPVAVPLGGFDPVCRRVLWLFNPITSPLCVSAYIGLSNPIREAPGAARLDPWLTSVRMGAPDRWTTPPESLERLDLSVSERSSLCKERISSAGSSSLREALVMTSGNRTDARPIPSQDCSKSTQLQVNSAQHPLRSEKKAHIDPNQEGSRHEPRLIFSRVRTLSFATLS